MTPATDLPQTQPKLAENIAHFARALRRAGLPIGPGRVIDAIRAVEAAGFTRREDFFWTLYAVFVTRPEQREVFAQLFRLFWRDPRELQELVAATIPALRQAEPSPPGAAEARAADALLGGNWPEDNADPDRPEIRLDASDSASTAERIRTLDFDQMTNAELAEARRMIARLTLPVPPLATRRRAPAAIGRVDPARTLRQALRRGGELQRPARTKPKDRWPDLVVLCDISGSMTRTSRMILHFVHAVAQARGQGWARVHAFTFGTRLTNITRHMRARDVDAALAAAGAEAQDWEGGTRIGNCLHDFNRDWSRRVMGQGAVVLLVTDGLDRGDPARLAAEAERLHLSARRVIWLNPLLSFDGFAPKARGIRALLPHVDSFLAGHSVASLDALGAALARSGDMGEKPLHISKLRRA
ncbi:von Willebrand factor A [Oceanicola sp. 22II-s10i]|uniref:vWA domain-containing protein n=1 Tax=Oceanicola sp. 22II-s10i TaxID=1317116 RepID=UPI000B5233CA|nr:VWA domain-containing protein [Oceanicola sp. 22II-s10i]OWU84759.1 von Willebrand factor A [Oceanicola sp. 22II-s10i]